MKILVFNWQDRKNPLSGGAEVHLHEVFGRIAKMGHEVTLFCSAFEGALREENIGGIHVIREGSRHLFNFLVPWRYFSIFRKERFDLVVDDLNKIPFYTPFYVKEPLLGIVHHLFGTSIFSEVPFPLASYVYITERSSLPAYRRLRFIVGSPSTYQELLREGFLRERVHLIPYGVALESFRKLSIPKSDLPLVGLVGRLKKYKSIDHLLEAFVVVLRSMPEARLVIVGDGDDKPRLMRRATELGISSSVMFTGFVSEEEKVAWLNKMHVAVNTSIKEGWGLTVIEANACGVPVVASNVPGLRDAVVGGKTGLLYEFGDRAKLAENILLLLRDRTLRERMEREALLHAKEFDWAIAADRTLEVIERVRFEHRKTR